MGLFARLRRSPPPPALATPPTSISKPRVLGNGKGGALNKENVDPKKKKKNGRGKKRDKKTKKSKKGRFWGREKKQETAPKLSLFLQQAPEDDIHSVATSSMTASHTTGSRFSVSSKSLSTASSSLSKPHSPLRLQSSQFKEDDDEERSLRAEQTNRTKSPSRSNDEASRSPDSQKKTKESKKPTSEVTKESSKIKSSGSKNKGLSASETMRKKQVTPLRSIANRQLTPSHPQPPKKKSKTKAAPKHPQVKAEQFPAQDNKVHEIGETNCSVGSNDVVFDDLYIANDFAYQDFDLSSAGPVDDAEKSAFRITNMKSLPLLSPLSSINSLAKHAIDEAVKRDIPHRSSTGEFAVIGSSSSTGDTFLRDVAGLQDIIDEVEKDMMELDSLFVSDGSKPRDLSEIVNNWARKDSGWIPNGALLQGNSEEASVVSFDSDEFAEDDDQEYQPIVRSTSSTSFEITTIIEENESDDEPLEAALKRGELLSMDAEEGMSSDEGLLSMGTSADAGNLSKNSKGHQYQRSGANGSVHTDSDLSDSFTSTSDSASPASSLDVSLKKKTKLNKSRPPPPSRRITKTLSWKEVDEVHTFTQPFKSINLEMALEMVRSYDPRYNTDTRATPQPPPRMNAQKPLKSILKKSKTWSRRDFSSSDDSSISQESNASTLSSNATSESVQYMVGKLKLEAARRRRKITIRRSTSTTSTRSM